MDNKYQYISLRKQTALEVLQADDVDGEFDYSQYSDEELWDAFVGAGYFGSESDIFGNSFVTQTPENCIDARELADQHGWPVYLNN